MGLFHAVCNSWPFLKKNKAGFVAAAKAKWGSSKQQQLNWQASGSLAICGGPSILLITCSGPARRIEKGGKTQRTKKKILPWV